MDIKEIAKRNYDATVRRLLIDLKSDKNSIGAFFFIFDIEDEVSELKESIVCKKYNQPEFDKKELADIVLVCFSMAEHFGIDLVKEMEEKMLYNEKRID